MSAPDHATKREFGALFLAAFGGDNEALRELLTNYKSTFRTLARAHLHERVHSVVGSSDCVAMLWEEVFVFHRRDWTSVEPDMLMSYFQEMVRNIARNVNEKHLGVAKRSLFRERHLSSMPVDWDAAEAN